MSSVYFDRYAFKERIIETEPHPDLGIVVTIPCYNEPDIVTTLTSLTNCIQTSCAVEIIVVINHSTDADSGIKAKNMATYQAAVAFASMHSTERKIFHILLEELPKKHAGVGLARKIAMDEAARRLNSVGKSNGVIVCFDADSICQPNYLKAIEEHFDRNSKTTGVSIHFEHPLNGELEPTIYEAIIDYELFLRYYVHACRYAGFPFAHQTIGSSMAVRNDIYRKQGGMNRRKAGEDFYFLQKIIPLGHFDDLTTTTVIPSPRQSDRVPFGTGKAVNDWLKTAELTTYDFKIFEDLHEFYAKLNSVEDYTLLSINQLEGLPQSILSFMRNIDFDTHVQRIARNSGSLPSFLHNFHRWFDGFKVLKYVHDSRDRFYPNVPVTAAAEKLFEKVGFPVQGSAKGHLLYLRCIDKKSDATA